MTTTPQFTYPGQLCPVALHAVRAARCWDVWGPYAARMYAQRHAVPSGLLTLARVLAAAELAGI